MAGAAGAEGTAQLWSVENSRVVVARRSQVNAETRTLVFSPDGKYLVTPAGDGSLHVWDWRAGSEAVTRVELHGTGRAVALSSHGRHLVTALGTTVEVWEWQGSGLVPVKRMTSKSGVSDVLLSRDATYLAISSGNTVRIVKWQSEEEVARFEHEWQITDISFSPDGKYPVTAGMDGTARVWLWTEAPGQEVARMTHAKVVTATLYRREILALDFSPNGKHLATAGVDGTVALWLWRPMDLIEEACSRLSSNLSLKEWKLYLGNEPYRKTCPNLPVPAGDR